MRLLLIFELVIFFVLPFPTAILYRRGINIEKPFALALATLLSLIMGTYWIYQINPDTLTSVTLNDWLFAGIFALFCWIFTYPLSRWLIKQWFPK